MDRVLQLFQQYDTAGNGQISTDEFSEILSRLGIPCEDVPTLLAAADTNRDNSIDYAEVLAFIGKGLVADNLAKLKSPGETRDIAIHVSLLSGKALPLIKADSSWTGACIKLAVVKLLDKGGHIRELRAGELLVRDDQTLAEFGFASSDCAELQAILGDPPWHPLWDGEFRRYGNWDARISRILVLDAAMTAAFTASKIRDLEKDQEATECQDPDLFQPARAQCVLMVTESEKGDHLGSVETVPVPSAGSRADVAFVVEKCQSLGIDAVVVGSGAVSGSDPQLVRGLKVALKAAGLKILVFGPCIPAEAPEEPSGGWDQLSTAPPIGARLGESFCWHCHEVTGRELSEHVSASIGSVREDSHEHRNYFICATWCCCCRCGATAPLPTPDALRLIRGGTGFVFRSSLAEAEGVTFALQDDFNGETVAIEVAQIDGEWSRVGSDPRGDDVAPICLEDADSFRRRLNALSLKETTLPGPDQPRTFSMLGSRRLSKQESQARCKAEDKEASCDDDENDMPDRATVTLKTGKWLGGGVGIAWSDGEMWSCLGKFVEPEEEY
eukprot:TRINITY_DN32216_c0_g1_i1.p1 TRINITY_DN32216_c0_g1~~TRINITY_DN32216_c0_g1_i1.p1  ORF type:complete len:556 (+),score=86.35 TRINITY_DN32216_c0_g1_i1:63-1730(+)